MPKNQTSPEEKKHRFNFKKIIRGIKGVPTGGWHYITFFYLLFVYMIAQLLSYISSTRFFPTFITHAVGPTFSKLYNRVISSSRHSDVTINRVNLIDLSIKNMRAKKSRTFITVGGMAVGIGAIVLLESIGYGLQELVINRVARLEELKQVNISPQQGNNVKIDDSSVAGFQNLPGVSQVLPQISLVGRVSFQNSNTDVAVYGVTTNYLTQSAIQPTAGTVFESNDLTIPATDEPTSFNSPLHDDLTPEEIALSALERGQSVLAEEDTTDTIDLSEIDPESQSNQEEQITLIQLSDSALKKAVVNRSFLRVLGISENEAVGKMFETTFVVVGSLLDNPEQKVETYPAQYEIVGVTSEDDAPFFYVPFIDLRGIGVSNYSQVKVVVQNQDVLANVRRQIEAMGYLTSSVVDTVSQIDSLFSTLRVVLAVVGLVAVAIAALGMFNTLTVSLLERTREVGFMKALGMKSHEIRDLFLTESLLMGIFGGIFGLAFGHFAGLGVNLILSIISWSQGGDYIDVSYIPPSLLTVVIILSFFVGVFTGYYPAHRATNISALNALRYE